MTAEATLTLRAPLQRRVDGSTVAWSALRGLDAAEIGAQEVWVEDPERATLGDLFEVQGAPAPRIRLVGDLGLMDGIGAGLTAGELVVDGDAGWHLGRRMSGGVIEVRGNAGPLAGAGPIPGPSAA